MKPISLSTLSNPKSRASLLKRLKEHPNEINSALSKLNASIVNDFTDEKVKEILHFCLVLICGTEDTESYFQELKDKDLIRNNVCGHVWQEGDAAYKCTSCEVEASCAVCEDCFHQGNHTGHSYKLIKVAGGVCDCGDFQSWKPTGFCSRHKGAQRDEGEILSALPPYLVSACQQVCQHVLAGLNTILKMEDWKKAKITLVWLENLCKKGDAFRCIVAEEWFRVDPQTNRCLLDTIMEIYNELPEKPVAHIQSLFLPLLFVANFRKRFLKRHFLPYYLQHIDAFISEGGDENDMISALPVQLFTIHNCASIMKDEKLIEKLVEKVIAMFKDAALPILKEGGVPKIDHEHIVIYQHMYSRLVIDLCYVISNKDLAAYFLTHDNIFQEWCYALHILQGMDKTIVRLVGVHAEYDSETWINAFQTEMEMMTALDYLLEGLNAFHKPAQAPETPTPNRGKETVAAPSQSPIEKIQAVINVMTKALHQWLLAEFADDLKQGEGVVAEPYPNFDFAVSKGTSTLHIPLHRYLSAFVAEAVKNFKTRLDELFNMSNKLEFFGLFVEHPLRIQVLLAQVRVGMWRRNGREVWAQCQAYDSIFFREPFRDNDIFALQLSALILGQDRFLRIALKRFEVAEFLSTKAHDFKTNDNEYSPGLLEEFVRFVVVISTERHKAGMSEEAIIRRNIIHRLAIADLSHSQLLNSSDPKEAEKSTFEKVLKEVATFQTPKGMEQGTYQLKEECWAEFDRYYPHFSRMDLEKAEERFAKFRSKQAAPAKSKFETPSKSRPAEVTSDSTPNNYLLLPTFPPFANLNHLLHSPILHKIIFVVLFNAAKEDSNLSETLLNEVLHLLLLSVHQYERIEMQTLMSPERERKRKRKSNAFTSSVDDIEFPTYYNIVKNARHEVAVANGKAESILSLLRKLAPKKTDEKIQQLINLLKEKDRKSLGMTPKAAENAEDSAPDEEQEKKRRRKERQAEILKKFNQQMTNFKGEKEEEKGKKEEEQPNVNPFPECGTCALCHEEASLFTKPLAFVALVMPSKLPQVMKSLQHRPPITYLDVQKEQKEKKQTGGDEKVEEDDDEESEESEDADEDMGDFDEDDFSDFGDEEEDDEMFGGHEVDKETDRTVRASAYMYKLMQDPEIGELGAPIPQEGMEMTGDFGESEDISDDGSESSISVIDEANLAGEQMELDEGVDEAQEEHPDGVRRQVIDPAVLLDALGLPNVAALQEHLSSMEEAEESNLAEDIELMFKGLAAIEEKLDQIEGGDEDDFFKQMDVLESKLTNTEEEVMELKEDYPENAQLPQLEEKIAKIRERSAALLKDMRHGQLFDCERGTFPNVQYCNGHVIHADCFKRYFLSLVARQDANEPFEGEDSVLLEKGEFLCVVCRRLANWMCPIIPFQVVIGNDFKPPDVNNTLSKWISESFGKALLTSTYEDVTGRNFTLSEALVTALSDFADSLIGMNPEYFNVEPSSDEYPLCTIQMMCSAVCNSVSSAEIALRGKGFVLEVCEKLHKTNLRSLFLCMLGSRMNSSTKKSQALLQHSASLHSLITCEINQTGETDVKKLPALLSIDPFSTLLQMLAIWSTPTTLIRDFYYLVNLTFRGLFAQILLHYSFDKVQNQEKLNPAFAQQVKEFLLSGKDPALKEIPAEDLTYIRSLCMPFLRRSGLLLFACFDKPLDDKAFFDEEFDMLVDFLSLPPLQNIFDSVLKDKQSMEMKWIQRFQEATKPNSVAKLPRLYTAAPFSLIPLPDRYQDLLATYSKVKCKKCETVPPTAALCLLCGALVCAGNPCCRTDEFTHTGECTEHAALCAGFGLFLILKMSSVLVIRGERHSFWGSPYLDQHGEEDIHLARGNTLYLSKERYEQLRELFVSHRIEYDSRIIEFTSLDEPGWY
eukprot:TRINITY_DN3722_c0_g1_i4.p1 TRINITY_DN3722_c0_g1~~TRINITY_DN3722_c0_g1_i4.p1  ORF type:complete len:1886 (+),score=640.18 TRINITY_DN3722_c0_g1_i4:152-5809(+)